MKTTVTVTGMTCQGCVAAVTRAIRRAAPEAEVNVDLKTGKVSVDHVASEAVVRDAVRDAGYGVAQN